MVFHRSFQNKLEHALDIRVGHFIELMAVPHLFKDILSLDLHQARIL